MSLLLSPSTMFWYPCNVSDELGGFVWLVSVAQWWNTPFQRSSKANRGVVAKRNTCKFHLIPNSKYYDNNNHKTILPGNILMFLCKRVLKALYTNAIKAPTTPLRSCVDVVVDGGMKWFWYCFIFIFLFLSFYLYLSS